MAHLGDIPTYVTRDQDIHTAPAQADARPQDFNSFSEQDAEKISGAIQGIGDTIVKSDLAKATLWSSQAVTQHTEDWIDKMQDYDNPQQFQKDYAASQQEMMKNAPGGANSPGANMFLERSDQMGVRLFRASVRNQAKDSVATSTAQWVDTAGNVTDTANNPNTPPEVLDALTQSLHSSAALAKGSVPTDTLASTTANATQAVDRAKVASIANTQGPAAAATALSSDTVAPSLGTDEKNVLAAQYVNKSNTDKGVEQLWTSEGLKQITGDYRTGQNFMSPQDEQLFAQKYAAAHANKKGTNYQEQLFAATQAMADSRKEGALSAQLFTMAPDDQQAQVDTLRQQYGEGSKQVAWAESHISNWDRQKKEDPVIFAQNDPTYRNEYNAASAAYDKAASSSGSIAGALSPDQKPDLNALASNFQRSVSRGLVLQGNANVSPENQRVLTNQESLSLASGLKTDNINNFRQSIEGIQQKYGPYSTQAFQDMTRVKGGIPTTFQILAQHADEPEASDLLNAFSVKKADQKTGMQDADSDKAFNDAMKPENNKVLGNFAAASNASMGGNAGEFLDNYRNAIKTYAGYLKGSGNGQYSTEAQAVNGATATIIDKVFGTAQSNGRQVLINRYPGQSGIPYTDSDISSLNGKLENLRQKQMSPDQTDIDLGKYGQGSSKNPQQALDSLSKSSYWALDQDGKTLSLRTSTPGTMASFKLPSKNGGNVSIPLNEAMAMKDDFRRHLFMAAPGF